ncbi:hypothetical protein PAE9249_04728 [Paenibacillus sp. CECT 9249]|nr:hypothetical protein PAE9249_04728 [Paenibacillus sp. CECT 9249]
MQFYICYKGKKLLGPMTKEEAVRKMFELRGTFKDLYIIEVDEISGKVKGRIGSKNRKK